MYLNTAIPIEIFYQRPMCKCGHLKKFHSKSFRSKDFKCKKCECGSYIINKNHTGIYVLDTDGDVAIYNISTSKETLPLIVDNYPVLYRLKHNWEDFNKHNQLPAKHSPKS